MYLIYSNPTSQTGRELAGKLNIPCGTQAPSKAQDLLIRWGSTEKVPNRPKRVLNNRAAIGLATDKCKSWSVLRANGVPTPEAIDANLALEIKGKLKFPVLGRTRHHSQGQDIILCLQAMDVRRAVNEGSEYFIEYIPTAREYRVHVFNGKIIRTSQKLWTGENYSPYVRNVANGYVFGQPKVVLTPQQEQSAVSSVTAMGLDFGAVDLIISDDNKAYVLEVNTGPALCPQGLDTYVAELTNFIKTL